MVVMERTWSLGALPQHGKAAVSALEYDRNKLNW